MAGSLTLRVITPEEVSLDLAVDAVRFPAVDGSMGVLPRHAPMVAAVGMGELEYRVDGREHAIFVAGGFAEVRQGTMRVVTEAAEPPDEIDIERARAAAQRARELLKAGSARDRQSAYDAIRVEASLRRALMRLSVAEKRRQ